MVNGWAAGGGHSLHGGRPDPASREHARFKQTDADVGRSTPGTAAPTWPSRSASSPEIFFLGEAYDAETMHRWRSTGRRPRRVGEHRDRLARTIKVMGKSRPPSECQVRVPTSPTTGLMGQQVFAGEATRLART